MTYVMTSHMVKCQKVIIEKVESMRHRLFDARKISREIIFETINNAERLEKYL